MQTDLRRTGTSFSVAQVLGRLTRKRKVLGSSPDTEISFTASFHYTAVAQLAAVAHFELATADHCDDLGLGTLLRRTL